MNEGPASLQTSSDAALRTIGIKNGAYPRLKPWDPDLS
ncbi:hypothetical protein SynMVIR181_00881 [Synechococcus sp. MVIR-18-1]|nr:hypothetical protein SynMVIR181_00881 [Synechococcus sp. MVIR-18-1]